MTWSTRQPRMVTTSTPLDTRGPKRLWDAPAGVVQRDRGDVGRLVRHDYRCPVHGVFELEVSSRDVPDEAPCPLDDELAMDGCSSAEGHEIANSSYCGLTSPWSPSRVGVWKSAGEVSG